MQCTMTGWQNTMSPGSPVNSTTRSGTPSTMVSASIKAAIRSAGDGARPVSAMSQGPERQNRQPRADGVGGSTPAPGQPARASLIPELFKHVSTGSGKS